MDKIYKVKEKIEINNTKFEIEIECYYDNDIKEYYVDEVLGNKNLKKIRNKYRELNNLLKDYEIENIRKKLNLTQSQFSLLLGLDENQIYKYETKEIQTIEDDLLIRKFLKEPNI